MLQKTKSVQHFVVLASLLVGVSGLFATPVAAQQAPGSTTAITAQLCADGERTPSGLITAPVTDSTVGEPSQRLTVTTSWVTSYDIYRGSNLLTSVSPVQFAADVTSTATVTLPQGTSTLRLVLHGGCPETTVRSEGVTLTYSRTDATVKPVETRQKSPRLTGFVSNHQAAITVSINNKTYTAHNNGDGTWTLPEGTISPELEDGTYDVRVVATHNGETVSDILTQGAVVIDTTAPIAELTTQKSSSRSPALTGSVDDPLASVVISLNHKTYTAHNNGDGTWTLPEGTIEALASGTYEVTIVATDRAGNSRTTTHTLEIHAPNELGFLLSPNTGFMRLQSLNIPSSLLYGSVAAIVAAGALLLIARRRNRADAK